MSEVVRGMKSKTIGKLSSKKLAGEGKAERRVRQSDRL